VSRDRTMAAGRTPSVPALVAGTVAVIAAGLLASPAAAQGFRGWAGTTLQGVELRPLAAVSDPCPPLAPCFLPTSEELSIVGTQDVSLTAWGFGVQGLSATMFLRGRAGLGGDLVWPRSEDHFDALLAYAQLVRDGWTARLGRQEIRSGLGFSSFDGGRVERRFGTLRLEAYGGRSLARGLREPANEALRGIEDFVPDQSIWLWGGSLHARQRTASATLRYQREILSDRSGLASERASLDVSTALRFAQLSVNADWDFGREQLGKGHLTVSAPFGDGRWVASATARRYVPYFALSTIWGFFEPVAYHELVARMAWSASFDLGVWVRGGWRTYGDTETVQVLSALRDTGWRAEAGAGWSVTEALAVNGSYELELGPGGFMHSADASVRWRFLPSVSASLTGMSFQQIEQYRLGDGRAWGGGASVDVDLTERLAFAGGGSLLRHQGERDGAVSPWSQSRFWTTLRVRLGSDPGLANRPSR
jgi:hypothetical protein